VYYIGESSSRINTEADSNDVTENPREDKPRPHVCTVCNKRFRSKTYLNVHRKRHTGENLYSCIQCEKCFPFQSSLSRHMNIHSSKYKCTECGKCCPTSRHLARHRQSHSGEKPFECTVCSKRFTQDGNLVTHSRIHSGVKPYQCHV